MKKLELPSVCALDCPDTCALLVQVGEDGVATRLRGNPDHPITRGFLCSKVTRYLDRQYRPDRILFPMRRIGAKGSGQFTRISWEEAGQYICQQLTEVSSQFGPESVLPYSYAGTMGLLNGSGMDRRFFHRFGASRLDRTICASAGGEALMRAQGVRLGTEPEQFVHSKLIIAWGANILGTNVHLWPFIVEARRRGAKLYVIDPVLNRTGRAADRHFAINPGSDLALAMGMIRILIKQGWIDRSYVAEHTTGFDELKIQAERYTPDVVSRWTGLSLPEIELLARDYATTQPATIRMNYGVQRSEQGGAAVRAIAALPVLTGSWRTPGGGLVLTTSGAFAFDRDSLEMPELQYRSPLGREARLINMSKLGTALLDEQNPPVKALVVYNSNPAAIAPHQNRVLEGLRRPDLFTVVLEHFFTDTARYADLVLPATTFLEHTDLYYAYGHYYLQLARPAIAAPGEAKSNVEIFRLLARQMDWREPWIEESEDNMIRTLLRTSSPYLEGITLEELDDKRSIRLKVSAENSPFLPFAQGAFQTGDGRFYFGGSELVYRPPLESRFGPGDLTERFPLELITPKADSGMNSTFGMKADADKECAVVSVHPQDAALRGIVDGDPVRILNQRGSCELVAHITADVKPGVLAVRSVRWNKYSGNSTSVGINVLTSETSTDIGGGPTFYNCLVELQRIGAQPPLASKSGSVETLHAH